MNNETQIPEYFGYSFYDDIEEILPKSLLDYWGMRNVYHICPNISFKEFIIHSLDNAFHDIEQVKLADHISKIRAASRQRRKSWGKIYYTYLEYDIKDPQHPVSMEYYKLQNTSPSDFISLYQDATLEDILEEKINAKNNEIDTWKTNKSALFTQYPAISILSAKQKEDALYQDIINLACNYITKTIKYDFDISTKSMPSPIVSKPIFGLSSSKIALEEIDGVVQSVIRNGGNGDTFSVIPVDDVTELATLNKYDYQVYQELTKIAESVGKEKNERIIIHINYYELATKLYDYAVNAKDIDMVKKSVAKLAARRFIHKQGTRRIEYVLIDSISYDIDDENTATLMLGYVVSEAILQKNLISISRKDENRIESKHGKAFMHPLQGLRFILYRDHPDDLSADITMDFFEECILFNTKSYKKKISIIMDSLDDYMSHEVLIKNYRYENDIFHLEFLPLSGTDLKYYTDWAKVNSGKKI